MYRSHIGRQHAPHKAASTADIDAIVDGTGAGSDSGGGGDDGGAPALTLPLTLPPAADKGGMTLVDVKLGSFDDRSDGVFNDDVDNGNDNVDVVFLSGSHFISIETERCCCYCC